ncbi:MAG: TIGR04255 family protein [Candidatus Latescibacteria bacterium]|nr:TIGR04255 family protein [Candidatus Latescibacterota bacterium]
MGEKLASPPIVEALCEFRFVPSDAWDWTIPGLLYEKIKGEFPERSQFKGLGVQIYLGPNSPPAADMRTGPERVQLKRSDGSAMVQIGENLLAINHLRPYPNWGNFREIILKNLQNYREVTEEVPLKRIGLRYINQIKVPQGEFETSDFITLEPPLSGSLDRPLSSFYQRYELVQDSPPGVLIHQTGIQRTEEQTVIMLDLDFGSEDVEHVTNAEEVKNWLNSTHTRVLEAFVASLNPDFYDRMKRGV